MRFYKHISKNIKTFLLLIIPFLVLGLSIFSSEQLTKADEEIVVVPKYTPTKDPKKFLGIWLTSGYSLQPKEDYYVTVNDSVTIKTNTGRSVWTFLTGALDSDSYQWWQTTDGKNWTKVSKADGGKKRKLPVTPKAAGTTWYQLDTQYAFLGINKKNFYSRIGAVHALPEPVDATSLDVTVDDDYLYNTSDQLSNTTYAHAKPTPSNATGTITWSVDDSSLATIDEDGEITANKDGKSGIVTVIATMTNPSGNKITGTKTVEIGGGLDDQKVKSGENATFTLKGNTGGEDDEENNGSVSIDWYRYDHVTDAKTKVESDGGPSYTTDDTTYADNNAFYQAVLTLKINLISKTITTNKARLTVTPSGDPNIQITNKMTNKSYSDESDNDHLLNNVVNQDNITYHDTLKNDSSEGLLKDAFYVIPMHSGTEINSVKINDEKLDTDRYSIIHEDDSDTDNLVISLDNLNMQETADIDVDTTAENITQKEERSYIPYVYGTNNDGNIYRKEAPIDKINYITNSLSATVQDINFGTINSFSKDTLKHRSTEANSSDNIIDFDDQRRDKNGVKVYVSQMNEFMDNNNETLPVSLRYYEGTSYTEVLNNKVQIAQTDNGQAVSAINWAKDDGLLLHVNEDHLKAGKYSTTLTWYFENSI